jgi:hypothetical protein
MPEHDRWYPDRSKDPSRKPANYYQEQSFFENKDIVPDIHSEKTGAYADSWMSTDKDSTPQTVYYQPDFFGNKSPLPVKSEKSDNSEADSSDYYRKPDDEDGSSYANR